MPADNPVDALREKVQAALAARSMTQQDLAESLDVTAAALSKTLSGHTLTVVQKLLERFRTMERKLKLPAGELVRILDGSADRGATQEAILRDGSLPSEVKQFLLKGLDAYSGTVTELDAKRRTRRASSKARPAAEKGETPAVPAPEQARLAKHVAKRKPKKP